MSFRISATSLAQMAALSFLLAFMAVMHDWKRILSLSLSL
jgi:hypothetical protein